MSTKKGGVPKGRIPFFVVVRKHIFEKMKITKSRPVHRFYSIHTQEKIKKEFK
jgi:hypothetical protein